jgi:hypothetical protein
MPIESGMGVKVHPPFLIACGTSAVVLFFLLLALFRAQGDVDNATRNPRNATPATHVLISIYAHTQHSSSHSLSSLLPPLLPPHYAIRDKIHYIT